MKKLYTAIFIIFIFVVSIILHILLKGISSAYYIIGLIDGILAACLLFGIFKNR